MTHRARPKHNPPEIPNLTYDEVIQVTIAFLEQRKHMLEIELSRVNEQITQMKEKTNGTTK